MMDRLESKNTFYKELYEMMDRPDVQIMAQYPQHRNSDTYTHCVDVAETAWKISYFFHLNVNEKSLARGAMLHDYYQYCFKETDISVWKHGFGHARIALSNAEKLYDLDEIERNIIFSHMWPLNLTHIPRYRESVLVGIADKYCAVKECLAG